MKKEEEPKKAEEAKRAKEKEEERLKTLKRKQDWVWFGLLGSHYNPL